MNMDITKFWAGLAGFIGGCLLIVLLTGFMSGDSCPSCEEPVSNLSLELSICQDQLVLTSDDLDATNLGMQQCASESFLSIKRALECELALEVWNANASNRTSEWLANTTRYSFTCNDIPLDAPPYNLLTQFRCYWDIRQQYGYGQYYNPMEVCMRTGMAGWIESCACVNEMSGVVYGDATYEIYATEYGIVGVWK